MNIESVPEAQRAPSKLGDGLALACLLAATLFFCSPFLENIKFLADDPDWHIQATMHASVRRTVL
ncbi:MAG: hypothetical protein FJ272_07010, partial [Planctomycetes bacterium]|nr:hypothetical protein [Planctomycetota bacterium]